MAGIDDLIAQGPGRRDLSPLGELFGAYREGVKARREDQTADARQSLGDALGPDGRPDYGTAALHLLRGGDVGGATALAHLAAASAAHDLAQAKFDNIRHLQSPDYIAAVARARAAAKDAPAPTAPAVPFGQNGGSLPSGASPATPELPKLTTREDVNSAIAEARATIAAGKERGLVLKRLRELGIDVSGI